MLYFGSECHKGGHDTVHKAKVICIVHKKLSFAQFTMMLNAVDTGNTSGRWMTVGVRVVIHFLDSLSAICSCGYQGHLLLFF